MNALGTAFRDAIAKAARTSACERVLMVGFLRPLIRRLAPVRSKVVWAVSDGREHQELVLAGFPVVTVPPMRASRTDRLKGALVAAMNAGNIVAGQRIACGVVSDDGELDMLMHFSAEEIARDHTSLLVAGLKTRIPAPLLEVLVDLALKIGREGYEGHAMGTLIVVGDTTHVMEQSTALTLNPFQGYSEPERNLFDQNVRSAVRQFAILDGAFVVREDGVVVSSGRHIQVSRAVLDLPLGWGARHTAAAAVTLQTDALAIAVSQTSGKVRIFDRGQLVLELTPGERRGVEPHAVPLPARRRRPAP